MNVRVLSICRRFDVRSDVRLTSQPTAGLPHHSQQLWDPRGHCPGTTGSVGCLETSSVSVSLMEPVVSCTLRQAPFSVAWRAVCSRATTASPPRPRRTQQLST